MACRLAPECCSLVASVDRLNSADDVESVGAQPVTSSTGVFRNQFLVPVRGYAKGGDAENVAFVGIAA
jgi:hypothetical protein